MTGLVDGDGTALLLGDDLGTFFQSADDAVDGIHEVLTLHGLFLATGCDEGGLVADVGDVGTREARRLACQEVQVNRAVGLDIAQVNLEDFLAVGELGKLDVNLAVETACPEQRLVEDVGTVGGGEDDHAAVGAKAVHLGEQLVERALALVVTAHVGLVATGTTHGVNLVDKDDAGGLLLGLAEEVSHARGTDADEHLDEIGT